MQLFNIKNYCHFWHSKPDMFAEDLRFNLNLAQAHIKRRDFSKAIDSWWKDSWEMCQAKCCKTNAKCHNVHGSNTENKPSGKLIIMRLCTRWIQVDCKVMKSGIVSQKDKDFRLCLKPTLSQSLQNLFDIFWYCFSWRLRSLLTMPWKETHPTRRRLRLIDLQLFGHTLVLQILKRYESTKSIFELSKASNNANEVLQALYRKSVALFETMNYPEVHSSALQSDIIVSSGLYGSTGSTAKHIQSSNVGE